MPLNVLVNGAGICGPAVALFLLHSDPSHNITVVERSPGLRTAGQQIDIRAQGIPIMKKLGLLEKVKQRTVAESGVAVVDAQGTIKALFEVNNSGKGQQALTSEYEIMRGDLVDVLYQESLEVGRRVERDGKGPGVKYEFGKYATQLSQDDSGVDVIFSDGSRGRYDLAVGCDGQGSRTRRMVWGEEQGNNVFKSLGGLVAFFSIPREQEEDIGKLFNLPEYRVVFTRTGNRPVTQVVLGVLDKVEDLTDYPSKSVEEQKAAWRKLYADCKWQRERLLNGLDTTEDFYMTELGQVKMDSWAEGRVVLVGDAGYAPSGVTGQGTTASLVGAYILAGELARHGDDVAAALRSYDKVLRPYVNEMQKLAPGTPNLLYPKTEWGIWALQTALGVVTKLQIYKVLNMILPDTKGGLGLPEYPDLNLPGDIVL
ncbi:hypothetical protein BKA67DRAFT_665035 [Truncatella angustata]|uniref:FAD-binding domain-containing protein n=1 Tax=Truncatella angustata TaxID=152316 RepID=A0A9P8UBQ0_9PEZI|nr:uncharacterized protein BKA67DRAFT_665035 [Truncatella angustata]KAH6645200.1 hypothetical protein BKA67DRAFT_665035 [Truncatella angustata]